MWGQCQCHYFQKPKKRRSVSPARRAHHAAFPFQTPHTSPVGGTDIASRSRPSPRGGARAQDTCVAGNAASWAQPIYCARDLKGDPEARKPDNLRVAQT